MILKDRNRVEETKKYLRENFLSLPLKIQFKIFLFKMKFLYPEIKQKIFYSPMQDLKTGLFGQSQLFTIGDNLYFYSPSPFEFTFRKVLGIYKIDKYTFMIMQTSSGYYQLYKDGVVFHIIFLSLKDAKNYMEVNHVRN